MTEYDFSPEGYEKYLETQNRVSNWVTDQSGRFNQYSNPFVPSQRSTSVPPASYPAHYTSHHSSSRRDGSHHSTSPTSASSSRQRPGRPEHTRSYTAPVGEVYRSSSRSHSHPRSQQSPPVPSHQSRATSPSSHVTYGHYREPHREKPRYAAATHDASGNIVLPPLRPGEQYRINPGSYGGQLYIVVSVAPPCFIVHRITPPSD